MALDVIRRDAVEIADELGAEAGLAGA